MTMNKREKAELEAAHERAALSWPTFNEPTPLTGDEVKAIVEQFGEDMQAASGHKRRGAWFWRANVYSAIVTRVCCDGVYIGGENGRLDSWWRGDMLFGSFEYARRWLAWQTARKCAKILRGVETMQEPQP